MLYHKSIIGEVGIPRGVTATMLFHPNQIVLLVLLSVAALSNTFATAPYGGFSSESNIDPAVMQIDELQHLGAPINRALRLVDSESREFSLGDMLGEPLLLLFSYYSCDGTCPVLNTALKDVLSKIKRFKIGRDYKVLTVSFDKHDTPETMKQFDKKLAIPAEMRNGWRHAILQQDDAALEDLTSSVGYKFFWSKADEVFLHPNVLIFLTPEGRVARYLYGTAMEKKELELALIDADWGRIANSSNLIDMLTGVCYSYNFAEGKYTLNYSLMAGVGSLLLGIALLVISMLVYRKKIGRRISHV